jgi:hypothetical protein
MRRIATLLPLLAALAPAAAFGQTSGLSFSAPAGRGQQALALRAEGGAVRAHVCAAAAGCTPDGGALLPLPEDVRALLPKATARTVTLAGGRVLVDVALPGEAGAVWRMLIAAPATGGGSEPALVWSGWTNVSRGEHGEERVQVVVEEPSADGVRVLVGERRADVTLCGRPTLVGAREVDPAALSLAKASSVQNLSAQERAGAAKLAAGRAGGEAPKSVVRALRATAASSAYEKKLAAITDGDPATAWSENKPGDGRGEFVSMSAPEEVGITGLDLIVRPTEDVPEGAAPKRMYLATEGKLFEVTMPEDAWRQPPGTRYTLRFPAEVHTSCLAVVLDEAYAPAGKANVRVTIAEVEARTAFDGASVDALAGALAGGSERSKGAAALLARAGEAGTRAAAGVYAQLDDEGKRLAAHVIDAAPCKDQVGFFAARFAEATADPKAQRPAPGDVDPGLAHARDRLRRCGRAAADALAKLIAEGAPRTKIAAADELAALAPDVAVGVLLDAMGKADDAARRDLRAALARAAKAPRAMEALRMELSREKLETRSDVVAIDLMRAAGPVLGQIQGAADSLLALAAKDRSLRGRYLLLAPAAELGRTGEARAQGMVREALRRDEDPHVRARAATVAGLVPGLADDLAAAIDDADPRVREAAAVAVADAGERGEKLRAPGLLPALGKRLAGDDWTFVRVGAARALGAMPADPAVDAALAAALRDKSVDVRGRVLDGLGAHQARAHIDAIRERQDDDEENVEVRARAILALGVMCDAKSADTWTKLARGARQALDDRDRRLGGAAIAALGELKPADLEARIGPIADKDAPLGLREMVKAALSSPGSCKK